MKLLFDFFPLVLFYAAFKYAKAHTEWAANLLTQSLGFMVSGGVVGPQEAPTLMATIVVVAAIALQIVYLLLRRKKVPTVMWVSLGLAVVFGGATVWLHNATFIKWKFSVLYWFMGASLWAGQALWKTNLLKKMLGGEIALPEHAWRRLNLAWVTFFLVMGAVNIYIAYNFSEDIWYNFKMFGSLGLMVVFIIAQAFYLSRYMQDEKS
ncbi:septation protein A [Uliginosibacterium sp. sgz301328]|uniref:septation protein A n=1 Tax=Uliginosibacterium sp. sgz301328 TaxID=3243764 RepID=UPI00359E71E8